MKKRKSEEYKNLVSSFVLVFMDMFTVGLAFTIGYIFIFLFHNSIESYTTIVFHTIVPSYMVLILIFIFSGLYTYRYDFWHETRLIIKSIFFSFVLIFAYFSLLNIGDANDRLEVIYTFLILPILLPINKIFIKKLLFNVGYWKLGVKVLSKNAYLVSEIFDNYYLGYIESNRSEVRIVFIDSHSSNLKNTNKLLEEEILSKDKVIFVPVFDKYQFSNSNIYELANARTSLIVLQNRLKSHYRIYITKIYNLVLGVMMFPLLMPVLGLIALLIKLDSKGPVFFKQKRLGKNGELFLVYKFRTMHVDSDEMLKQYLEANPKEVENYEKYHKYDCDPRITKVGNVLRNTSLDELAQLINILKSEMNFVGPRPYMLEEKELIGEKNQEVILKVEPGITGLWQVSGRSELSFQERIELDKWYIQNWSMWMDFVVLLKTFNVVLNKVGAK